jgi:hypothetical protein
MDQKAPPPSSSSKFLTLWLLLSRVCSLIYPCLKDVVYNAYTYFFSAKSNVASSPDAYPVADRSLLLLLLLSTQFKDGSSEKSGTEGEAAADQDLQWACAYRQAIAEISGDQGTILISFIYCGF